MDVKIKKKRTKQDIVLDILIYLFLAFVVIICVYPFWNIFIFQKGSFVTFPSIT